MTTDSVPAVCPFCGEGIPRCECGKRTDSVPAHNDYAQIAYEFEMSNPPTVEDALLFLNDPELDFTPAQLVSGLRRILARSEATHPGCAGCDICTDHWILQHAADYFEAALALVAELSSLLATARADGRREAFYEAHDIALVTQTRGRVEGDTESQDARSRLIAERILRRTVVPLTTEEKN